MNHTVVDFETYYDKNKGPSASTQGVPNYVRDSYAYIVSIVDKDRRWVGTVEEAQKEFPVAFFNDPDRQFWAANSNFDQAWTEKYWPDVQWARPWQCVLDRGAVSQLPHSLAGLTGVVFGQKIDKTLRDKMSGVHWADLSASGQAEMKAYCLNDSIKEFELLSKIPEPTAVEQAVAAHTRGLNRAGVYVDQELLERNKTELMAFQHRALLQIPWYQDGAPLSHAELKKYCAYKGIPAPASTAKKDNDELDGLMDVHPDLAGVIDAMRRFRKANTIVRKIESIQDRITPDGRIPLEMMYCGARHTRRWSSRGVNVQNLDREPYFLTPEAKQAYDADESLTTDYVWPRHWIIPPPGKIFLILDYSQVEPRCLHWLVENEALLQRIRAGYSVYEAYASVAKGWKGAPGTLKKGVGVVKYTLIKNEVLGLGYGMGAAKYETYAGVDAATAKTTVENFRRANPKIVIQWRKFDELIKSAALEEDKLLQLEMPSGDYLRHFYVRPNRFRGYESYTTKGDFTHASHQDSLWGGTLTENVIQRFARDVMAEAVLRLDSAGFQVVFTSHDEVVLAIDEVGKEEAKAEARQIMIKTPDWCKGLPLEVEGDFSTRYTK